MINDPLFDPEPESDPPAARLLWVIIAPVIAIAIWATILWMAWR